MYSPVQISAVIPTMSFTAWSFVFVFFFFSFSFCGARDQTQGLRPLGKHSTTETDPPSANIYIFEELGPLCQMFRL
jgi:hypothetical protein